MTPRRAWRSALTTAAVAALALVWLAWPFLSPYQAPSAAQSEQEAPWLTAAFAVGLVCIALARWFDDLRQPEQVGFLLFAVAINTIIRLAIAPGVAGIEPVLAVPLLVGVALGASAGFFVGAASCLVSTVVLATAQTGLPGQMLAWGVAGLLGGLLSRARPALAWAGALPLAFLTGPLVGVILNATTWPIDPRSEVDAYFPGLPAWQNLQRLLLFTFNNTSETAVLRGIVTVVLVMVIGYPLIRFLRQSWALVSAGVDESAAATREPVNAAAVQRRRDIRSRARMWQTGDKP